MDYIDLFWSPKEVLEEPSALKANQVFSRSTVPLSRKTNKFFWHTLLLHINTQ